MATAAAYASKAGKNINSSFNNPATTAISSTKVGISSPFLSQPIKIEIPSMGTHTTFPITGGVGGMGNINLMDNKPIRFVPPKVNTANNRVPANSNISMPSGPSKNFRFNVYLGP